MLISLKQNSVISAKNCCILAYWASKAGAVGLCNKLAYRPDDPSTGHYSRHFDDVVGTRLDSAMDWYDLSVPGHKRSDASRCTVETSFVPPHEALDAEIHNIDASALLRAAKNGKHLPPSYFDHLVVVGAPAETPVYPIAVYMDGVRFTRTDSAHGVTVYNVLTGVRHLVAVLRKSEVCRCGCRGWCTMWHLFQFLHWSFATMAAGVHPSARHDGSAFLPSDSTRAALSGVQLGWRAALLFLKADLAEFCNSYGFPSWSSTIAPCFFVSCDQRSPALDTRP